VARFRFWIHNDLLLRYDGEMTGFPRGAALGPDGRWRPHDWSFQVNSITMLGELVQIILADSYLASTGTPGTWVLETVSRPASPLAVITYPRAGEHWLVDPAQYLIQMPAIYDAAAEKVSLHVGHPFTHDPGTVVAQLAARVGGPVPSYEFTGNTAAREQPSRPEPPW